MSIWFVLWLVLSTALLYFLFWTLFILYKQKQAWKAYAKAKKLRYDSSSPLSPPTLNGPVDEYSISMFTGEHLSVDARGTRKLNAIEIQLDSRMPMAGGIASGGMVNIMARLSLKDESRPDDPRWVETYVAKSENRAVMEAYLTPARIDVLIDLMRIKNAWAILVFKDDMMLLRLDTADPLANEKKLDALVKKMIESARALELQPGESERLKGELVKKPRKQAGLEVEGDAVDTSGLRLEDDDQDQDDEKPLSENS